MGFLDSILNDSIDFRRNYDTGLDSVSYYHKTELHFDPCPSEKAVAERVVAEKAVAEKAVAARAAETMAIA